MDEFSDTVTITPKNWASFQHYKHRRPPWIRLYRSILDDADFQCLQDASRALAPCLWLISSEYENGKIVAPVTKLAWRLRTTKQTFVYSLIPLLEIGYFSCSHDASALLALCKQNVTTEKSRVEKRLSNTESVSTNADLNFEKEFNLRFWPRYPIHNGRREAFIAWPKARAKASCDEIMAGLERYLSTLKLPNAPKPKYAQGWLNGERWRDEHDGPKINGNGHAPGPATVMAKGFANALAKRNGNSTTDHVAPVVLLDGERGRSVENGPSGVVVK